MTQALCARADGSGRTVVTEILIATPAIRNLIREGKTHQIPSFMQSGAADGMLAFDQHLAERVRQQVITFEQGLELCHSAEEFQRLSRTELTADADDQDVRIRDRRHRGQAVEGPAGRQQRDGCRPHAAAAGCGATVHRGVRQRAAARADHPGGRQPGHATGPGGLLPPVRHHDLVRHVAAALAGHPGGPDQQARAEEGDRRGAHGRRGRRRRCRRRWPSTTGSSRC